MTNNPAAVYLFKLFKSYHIDSYVLGYMGVCHNCDSRISAPFKFTKGRSTCPNGDFALELCFPLVCTFCGMEHKQIFIYDETTQQRKGEKVVYAH